MKVKKNDNVLVLTGKDAKKTGVVLGVEPKTNKVRVDGINVQRKSKKARRANETSEIVNQVGPIDASNVMVICPSSGKATRGGYKFVEVDGKEKKIRVCKKCVANLDKEPTAKKAAKESKKSTKETKEKA